MTNINEFGFLSRNLPVVDIGAVNFLQLIAGKFKELWEKIKYKTRYAVNIDTEKLINDVVAELRHVDILPPRVSVTKAKVDLDLVGSFHAWQMSAAKTLGVTTAGLRCRE